MAHEIGKDTDTNCANTSYTSVINTGIISLKTYKDK